jgi:hypothetical protein
MAQTNEGGNKSDSTKQEVPHNHTTQTPINRILERLSPVDIPAKGRQVEYPVSPLQGYQSPHAVSLSNDRGRYSRCCKNRARRHWR